MHKAISKKRPAQEETRVEDTQLVEVRISSLKQILRFLWSAETSVDPNNWNPDNPAWGQCAVTALLVQELFGGSLIRATIEGISHYWNVLPNGEEIDLTRHQFGESSILDNSPELRVREYVLSFPETNERYRILRSKILREIGPSKVIRHILNGDEPNEPFEQ